MGWQLTYKDALLFLMFFFSVAILASGVLHPIASFPTLQFFLKEALRCESGTSNETKRVTCTQ